MSIPRHLNRSPSFSCPRKRMYYKRSAYDVNVGWVHCSGSICRIPSFCELSKKDGMRFRSLSAKLIGIDSGTHDR